MSKRGEGNENPQSAKVLQLGFNISVSGDPDTDFQIVLDEKQQKALQLPSQSSDVLQLQDSGHTPPNDEIDKMNIQEVKPAKSTGAIPKKNRYSLEPSKMSEMENPESTTHKDLSLIEEIKNTMEHFEKFSDHIREVPRIKNHPLASSTPFSDKQNSKSESSLIYPEYRPRRFPHLYDFQSRKEYFKGTVKPLPPDLFLKPLPGENLYKRGSAARYVDLEPYRHYGSFDSISKTSDYKNALCPKSKYEIDKYDLENSGGECPVGILKKSDSESGDKQSTSSADSIKDIKIYQSGGIIIMQNFKDNMDVAEKREISDFSAKLIENCHKLRDEISSGFLDDRPFVGNSSDEGKNSGKMVQFDLSGFEGQKSKSSEMSCNISKDDCSPGKLESSESTSDCIKNKDASPQGTSQSQDFPSLSTQENDSVVSNQPGLSPTNASGKKLEWDSGADVGYLNLDLSKENLSTIERIVLKGISSDGLREKKVVYEKKPEQIHPNRSKFILERLSSDSLLEDISTEKKKSENGGVKSLKEKSKSAEVKTRDEPSEMNAEGVMSKDEGLPTNEEITPPTKEKVTRNQDEVKPKCKRVESTDKSVNVNTLFDDEKSKEFRTPVEYPSRIKASKLSPKIKKLKKKRVSGQKSLTGPLKDKIESIIDIARSSGRSKESTSFEMGIPRRVHKKVEANPELNDLELSRDVEEIIIDQRFKIKQNVTVGRDINKGTTSTVISKNDENVEVKKDTKPKNRPISASSSSNNTVLPNAEAKEDSDKKETVKTSKFTDQKIQTNDCEVESVGIQAFASLKSNEEVKIVEEAPKGNKNGKDSMNMTSKNVQSFGLNSSLPKELAHPKESKIESQNTKGTQFFGGPVNSLPNYHASLLTKPEESCGRMPKVLKARKNLEAEIIRLKEENVKNILANDSGKMSEPKRRKDNMENKENLVVEKSANSKRSQSMSKSNKSKEVSRETEKSGKEVENSEARGKKMETPSPEESECRGTSEEVSSKILTSEVLKEHGESIDRNIIQEKYFQSQLIELEKREMVSRSTSMEKRDEDSDGKELVTVGCQYSPQSKETTSEEVENGKTSKKETLKRYDSSQNLMGEERFGTSKSTNQEQDFGAGESFQSSTQTAHSWVPGMRDSDLDTKSGVGRARSFEYLPGHIYESSGNLRELPSETEQNLSCSSDTGKQSISVGEKDSEGRKTLVLENSTDVSDESDRMKILNENLTQLDLVVSKLMEKDTEIQSITRTLLVNLWKNDGSGDSSRSLGGGTTHQQPKANQRKRSTESSSSRKEIGNGDSRTSSVQIRNKSREKDISIACQTEEKSSMSDPEKFYEERKVLEKRISEEKESQIKWIENEIHHLNILRGLLEKHSFSSLRKKRHSPLTLPSSDDAKSEDKYLKGVPGEIHPPPVTPVYGCTISLVENQPENCQTIREDKSPVCEPAKYGMAVSLTGGSTNLQRVVMLPVGVQVTLKDTKLDDCSEREVSCGENIRSHSRRSQRTTTPESASRDCNHHYHNRRVPQSDINTQCPSVRNSPRTYPSAFTQTSFSSVKCRQCLQGNCVCLNLSEKSYESTSRSYKSKGSGKSPKMSFDENNDEPIAENEKPRSNSTDADVLDIESDPVSRIVEKSCGNRTESFPSYSKSKSIQESNGCKCPKRMGSRKQESVCRGPCQSSIYLNCNKSTEGFGSCRCSKIQVQKSSTCACHIIKIHGSKCCSPENGSCKRKNKKTENQCCQTEEAAAKEPENEAPAKAETPPANVCNCQKKSQKEKPKDDHPRHYFLKIEETEVDDLNESAEERKSLEVITVTVPVKKAGKAKIYGNKVRQGCQTDQYKDLPPKPCNCCDDCPGSRKTLQQYEPEYRSTTAERPGSPRRKNSFPKSLEGICDDDYRYNDPNRQQFSEKCRIEKSKSRLESCACSELTNSLSRDFQSEYDSHKESRRRNESTAKKRFHEDGREYAEQRNPTKTCQERFRQDLSSESMRPRTESDLYNSDYYNYNKKEFMTKSELMKEEEIKGRVHQPSLQECLASNRPDFCSSAESRRQIISARAKERARRHDNRVECLMNMMKQCNGKEDSRNNGPRRIFTTSQMREQTMKKYRQLPEVTGRLADEKKKQEYRTNKLMGDIYGKKLQIEALKGHINLSNSVSVLSMI